MKLTLSFKSAKFDKIEGLFKLNSTNFLSVTNFSKIFIKLNKSVPSNFAEISLL